MHIAYILCAINETTPGLILAHSAPSKLHLEIIKTIGDDHCQKPLQTIPDSNPTLKPKYNSGSGRLNSLIISHVGLLSRPNELIHLIASPTAKNKQDLT